MSAVNLLNSNQPQPTTRCKRSLLPFLGTALSWLTDTATTKDIRSIRTRINQIIATQSSQCDTLVHIVSILNVTRYAAQVNRHSINSLMDAVHSAAQDIDNLFNVTSSLASSINFNQITLHVRSVFANLRDTMQYLCTISTHTMDYIDAATSGQLSPHVLPTVDLQQMLHHIAATLPPTVKSTLKIPPRHNGVVPIKISGPSIPTDTAHFIADASTHKGKDPNISIIEGIHKIKDRSTVNVIVSNYTNKHLIFHKGEHVGHLEPLELQPIDQGEQHQTNSVTLQKMMSETVTSNTFNPPCHDISASVQNSLTSLLEEYDSQFAQDETSIGTTTLTSMSIDTGNTNPVSQKPYPIAMKHYDWVKSEIEKLLAAKVICSSCSSWSAPIIVVPKGDGGKCLVIDYRALNKVTRKFTWQMPKVEDIFSKLNGATYFTTLDLRIGYHHIPLDKSSIPKTAFNSPFGKYEYIKVSFGLAQAPAYFQELMTGILKDFPFAITYLDDIIIFSKTLPEHLSHIRMVFEKL